MLVLAPPPAAARARAPARAKRRQSERAPPLAELAELEAAHEPGDVDELERGGHGARAPRERACLSSSLILFLCARSELLSVSERALSAASLLFKLLTEFTLSI